MLKAYTYATKRDDSGVAAFSEFAKLNQADGLVIFTVPEVVAPDQEAIDRIQADTVNWRGELAKAIQQESFGQAAEIKDRIQDNDNQLAHVRDSGMTWLKEAMGEMWGLTQVFVLGGEYFPDAKSYPPTVGEFMQHVAPLSATLCSSGLCGAPAHRTPLQTRVFVPIGSVAVSMQKFAWTGESTPPVLSRDDFPPQSPRKESTVYDLQYEDLRQAAKDNFIYPASNVDGPATLIPDKVTDLNSDEKRVAEKLLEGLAVARAANACGMSWQSIGKTLKPSIVAKFAAVGLDFDALWEKAKKDRAEKSEE